MNLNICGANCTNLSNNQIGCEKVLDNNMNVSSVEQKLCEFYEETIHKNKYSKIVSSTIIENKRADEYFFGDIVSILIGCFNLNVNIQTMNKASNYGFSNSIKNNVQDSVKKILFGKTLQIEKIIKACYEVDNYYGTDIFSSIATKIDVLYR